MLCPPQAVVPGKPDWNPGADTSTGCPTVKIAAELDALMLSILSKVFRGELSIHLKREFFSVHLVSSLEGRGADPR